MSAYNRETGRRVPPLPLIRRPWWRLFLATFVCPDCGRWHRDMWTYHDHYRAIHGRITRED